MVAAQSAELLIGMAFGEVRMNGIPTVPGVCRGSGWFWVVCRGSGWFCVVCRFFLRFRHGSEWC